MKNNREVIFEFIQNAKQEVTHSDIMTGTGITPHQQIYQRAQDLFKARLINGRQKGRIWYYWGKPNITIDDYRKTFPASYSNLDDLPPIVVPVVMLHQQAEVGKCVG